MVPERVVPQPVANAMIVRVCASLLAVVLAAGSVGVRAAETGNKTPSNAARCAALQSAGLEPATIVKTELIPAGSVLGVPPGVTMAAPLTLPEHCFVQGTLESRTGVDGRPYHIGFELRLPTPWNGRFLFQGGSGLDGVVRPAIGRVGVSATPALMRGFAVVSNDSGHQVQDASFGFDQQARLNFGYAAIGKVTAEAKRIIARFYGRSADHSYFVGCSNGGRQAMMAADRYPDQFDGIVAGDPAFRLSAAALAQVWDTCHFASVAPHDAQGRPILSQSFTPAELSLVAKAVVQQCDALDGLADGMINNLQACHFKVAKLTCRAGQSGECLSAAKVRVLDAVFKGAHDSHGHALYSSWPYDSGIGDARWRAWKIGSSLTAAPDAINVTLGLSALQEYFLTPPLTSFNPAQFDFDHDPPRVAQTAAIDDATSTFLSSFTARGGRLLIYQGVSDPVFSANDIIDWYQQLSRDTGPPQAWARLFLVPGMTHCLGGPSTDDFDTLDAIQAWVEHGSAPDRIVAKGSAFPGITRPLCPYPQYARYTSGDAKSAASFQCQ
jgi:pimeloyl-ACP methyl ester carboxylesterase